MRSITPHAPYIRCQLHRMHHTSSVNDTTCIVHPSGVNDTACIFKNLYSKRFWPCNHGPRTDVLMKNQKSRDTVPSNKLSICQLIPVYYIPVVNTRIL
jgi:hypothetical protein